MLPCWVAYISCSPYGYNFNWMLNVSNVSNWRHAVAWCIVQGMLLSLLVRLALPQFLTFSVVDTPFLLASSFITKRASLRERWNLDLKHSWRVSKEDRLGLLHKDRNGHWSANVPEYMNLEHSFVGVIYFELNPFNWLFFSLCYDSEGLHNTN